MKKIEEAISLANTLQEKIVLFDELGDELSRESQMDFRIEILNLARGLAEECNKLLPLPDVNWHQALPQRTNEALRLLLAYHNLKSLLP